MIIYDQLRISDDGKRLYINAHVNKASLFEGTTIEKLCICLGSKVYETTTIDPECNGVIYSKDYEEGTKEINEVISIDDPSLLYNKTTFKDLLFVYVKCAGIPEDASCYVSVCDYVLGVVFDENLLYQRVMGYTKELANDCQMPLDFMDFILLWNAFKASIETEHYIPAIKYYNMLFDETKDNASYTTYKTCGCHG